MSAFSHLTVTSRKNDKRIGVLFVKPSDHLSRLAFRRLGHRATVDDIDIGGAIELRDLKSRDLEGIQYLLRLVLINFATQRRKSRFWHNK